MKPTFGSLFAGLGGFDLALERCGFECRWQVEISPSARKVLTRHWPDVERHKDIHNVGRRNLEPVDIVCGGWPCQDLSTAGKGAGLAGERSGLFFEAGRVISELKPALVLLENVPGLLSIHHGRDFAIVLHTLRQLGARDIAWRVLDAQYSGVPQRRRRVFLVADFREERAASILFESEGMRWHPAKSRKTGTRTAATLTGGSATGSGVNPPGRRQEDDLNIVSALTAGGVGTCGADDNQAQAGHLLAPMPEEGTEVAGPLTRRYGKGANTTADDGALVTEAYQCHGSNVGPMETLRQENGNEQGGVPFVTHSLSAEGSDASEDGTGRGTPLTVAYRKAQKPHDPEDGERWEPTECRDTLSAHGTTTASVVAFAWQQGDDSKHTKDGRGRSWITRAGDYAAGLSRSRHDAISGEGYGVRRLMPIECERLQGLPDNWTKGLSDSARYRLIGNGVAVPVIEWIGRRLFQHIQATAEDVA